MSEHIGRVAFIGLGVMGYPMAGHLAKHASSPRYLIAILQEQLSGWISIRAAQGNALLHRLPRVLRLRRTWCSFVLAMTTT